MGRRQIQLPGTISHMTFSRYPATNTLSVASQAVAKTTWRQPTLMYRQMLHQRQTVDLQLFPVQCHSPDLLSILWKVQLHMLAEVIHLPRPIPSRAAHFYVAAVCGLNSLGRGSLGPSRNSAVGFVNSSISRLPWQLSVSAAVCHTPCSATRRNAEASCPLEGPCPEDHGDASTRGFRV